MDVWNNPTNTPCSHIFCKGCIEQSLRNKPECPLCKVPLNKRSLRRSTTLDGVVGAFLKLLKKVDQNAPTDIKQSITTKMNNTLSVIEKSASPPPIQSSNGQITLKSNIAVSLLDVENEKVHFKNQKLNPTEPTSVLQKRKFSQKQCEIDDTHIDEMEVMVGNCIPLDDTQRQMLESALRKKQQYLDQISMMIEDLDKGNIQSITKDKYPIIEWIIPQLSLHPPTKKLRADNKIENDHQHTLSISTFQCNKIDRDDNSSVCTDASSTASEHVDTMADTQGSDVGAIFFSISKDVKKKSKSAKRSVTSSSPSPSLSSGTRRHTKPYVLLGTLLDPESKKKLKSLGKELGAKIVEKLSPSVTHIITSVNEKGLAKRTIKYSTGITCGCWIVSYEWAKASEQHGYFVDEIDYEVKGDANALNGPRLGRLAKEQKEDGLFSGWNLYFHGTFLSPNPAQKELKQLVQCGGGIILEEEPTKYQQYGKVAIIIDKDRTPNEMKRMKNETGIHPILFTWLLDCTSNYKIVDQTPYRFNF